MSRSDREPTTPSANERLREGWQRVLRRSTTFAVAAHVALLALSFTWRISYQTLERVVLEDNALLLLPGFGDAPNPGTTVVADSLPGEPTETEAESEAGLDEGTEVDATSLGDRWEALGARLRGRGAPLPTLSEPRLASVAEVPEEEPPENEDGTANDEGAPSIGGDARMAELAELPEPDSLSLGRLSSLRPELAFMTASAWVLIRNQNEVETFLRSSYLNGRLDPDATGSVSVTLWIDRRGSVEWAEVSESSGRQDLDEFTLALFNEVASFRAAREQGVYVSRSVTFSVNYPW